MTYERKCENWLLTFRDWITPLSEAPASFVAWTGIFVLSSVLRRKVNVPKSILGRWAADPNQYIFFVGDAGRVRKTTTMGGAQELLEHISDLTSSPEIITKEDILNKITKSPDGSMYIFSPEFSEFVAKSGPSMYSFLTNMYDGKKSISASTLSRGLEFREKPCVNLLAATTPAWIAENMSEAIIGGGFASRVIFIFEDEVSKRRLIYKDIIAEMGERLEGMKLILIDDLQHINTLEGEFSLSEDAAYFLDHDANGVDNGGWYQQNADAGRNHPKLSGYFERKPAHVLKVAMAVHISYSDTLELNIQDIQMAIGIVNKIEKKLPKVFENVGKNPYQADMASIIDYVKDKGRCTRSEIRQVFSGSATPSMLTELIDGLIAATYLLDIPLVDESGNRTGQFVLEANLQLLGLVENVES